MKSLVMRSLLTLNWRRGRASRGGAGRGRAGLSGLLALIEGQLRSGRYRARELVEPTG